jgi:hypothetical protein
MRVITYRCTELGYIRLAIIIINGQTELYPILVKISDSIGERLIEIEGD